MRSSAARRVVAIACVLSILEVGVACRSKGAPTHMVGVTVMTPWGPQMGAIVSSSLGDRILGTALTDAAGTAVVPVAHGGDVTAYLIEDGPFSRASVFPTLRDDEVAIRIPIGFDDSVPAENTVQIRGILPAGAQTDYAFGWADGVRVFGAVAGTSVTFASTGGPFPRHDPFYVDVEAVLTNGSALTATRFDVAAASTAVELALTAPQTLSFPVTLVDLPIATIPPVGILAIPLHQYDHLISTRAEITTAATTTISLLDATAIDDVLVIAEANEGEFGEFLSTVVAASSSAILSFSGLPAHVESYSAATSHGRPDFTWALSEGPLPAACMLGSRTSRFRIFFEPASAPKHFEAPPVPHSVPFVITSASIGAIACFDADDLSSRSDLYRTVQSGRVFHREHLSFINSIAF